MREMGDGMGKRDWVKSVAKKLRDDMGDCPTLPQEMLDLVTRMRTEESDEAWGGAMSSGVSRTLGGAARQGGPVR
jgi:hypothetical protein